MEKVQNNVSSSVCIGEELLPTHPFRIDDIFEPKSKSVYGSLSHSCNPISGGKKVRKRDQCSDQWVQWKRKTMSWKRMEDTVATLFNLTCILAIPYYCFAGLDPQIYLSEHNVASTLSNYIFCTTLIVLFASWGILGFSLVWYSKGFKVLWEEVDWELDQWREAYPGLY